MARLDTRFILAGGFGMIAALFAIVAGGMLWRVSSVRNQTRALVAEMLDGAEDVARIGRDVERERRLVDTHIFEKRQSEMERVEREIAGARADYAKAAGNYAAV